MKAFTICQSLLACACFSMTISAADLSPDEARTIAQESCIYFYPLVIMDVTSKHFSNIEPDKMFGRGPINTFTRAPTFPPGTFQEATHRNFDTLYSGVVPCCALVTAIYMGFTWRLLR
jgi:hypothetical protein